MKSLCRIALVVFISSILANIAPAAAKDNERLHDWVCSLSDVPTDSIHNTYIFYWHGHNGMNWGMIYPDSTGLRMANGTTRTWEDKDSSCSLIDTAIFLGDNAKTIQWAFESLPNEAKGFEPRKSPYYGPFFREVFVVKDGVTVFHYKYDIAKYDGKNSKEFNAKLGELTYLMLWVSLPSHQHQLVTPCDRPHPKKGH
ncbi:MAG: hypothetical protein K2N16_04250 [Muribaculaceae bacterium]|nr:hypothetical protein [Muribaculaceae bacterium]